MFFTDLPLCHNSFSFFCQLLKYIKYRITGGMSYSHRRSQFTRILCTGEKIPAHGVIVQCARIPKISSLCILSPTLHPPIVFQDSTEKYEDDTVKASAVTQPFSMSVNGFQHLYLYSSFAALNNFYGIDSLSWSFSGV